MICASSGAFWGISNGVFRQQAFSLKVNIGKLSEPKRVQLCFALENCLEYVLKSFIVGRGEDILKSEKASSIQQRTTMLISHLQAKKDLPDACSNANF